jgi:uracil phosphoribosyltransferase
MALLLGHLPFHNQTIRTPTGEPYNGVAFSKKICGVSIIRSGEAMEVRRCIIDSPSAVCLLILYQFISDPPGLNKTWHY